MKRQDELNEAWCNYMGKCSIEIMQALAFALRWADAHPRWISVEDELPPRDTFFNISKMKKEHIEKFNLKDKELDTSIGCLVVIRGGMLGLANYNYKEKAWSTACCDEVTHWMPLPEAPLVTDLNKKDLPPVSCQEGDILVTEEGGEE